VTKVEDVYQAWETRVCALANTATATQADEAAALATEHQLMAAATVVMIR